MIKFETLILRNFLSFGNVPTIVQLNVPGTALILGESLDDTSSGNVANGTGKTTLLNALVYAVYDKPISNISKDNLVNNVNKKNMEVSITFKKGEKRYTIKRFRKKKAGATGNYAQLFENGKDITPDSVGNINAAIEKIMGIPYELFVRIVAFPATLTPFLDLPVRSHYAANQTDIIEELFNLKILSEKADLLKSQIKDTEGSLKTITIHAEHIEQEIERHNTQIKKAKERVKKWERETTEEIKQIEEKLKKLESVNIDEQRKLHEKSQEYKTKLSSALETQRKVEREIRKYEKIKKEKQKELSHLRKAECPYCHQKFEDTESKIKECEKAHNNAEQQLIELDAKQKVEDEKVETLSRDYNTLMENVSISNLDELLSIKSKSVNYIKRLDRLKQETNPHLEPLNELKEINLTPPDQKRINELKEKIDHQKFLLKLLTKKDSFVRKALLNKNIPFLNQRLSHYLVELGLPHSVEFTHEMIAKISQFGREMDFGNLSNGQQARVNLALSFAFRDVLQSLHEHINVCMLDEILDVGLDAVGVRNAARMLKRKARDEKISLYIISHRDEIDSAFDRKITVQMANGFSSLRYDD